MKQKYSLLGAGLLLLGFLVWMFIASAPAGIVILLLNLAGIPESKYMNYLVLGLSELLLIAPLILYMAITKTGVKALLGNRTSAVQLLLAAAIGITLAPAIQGVNEVFAQIFLALGLKMPDTSMMEPDSVGTMFVGMLAIGATAGIVEEPIFRGVALRGLGSVSGRRAAVWLSAAVFSIIHLEIIGAPTRLLIGVLLGYMAWRSGAILPGVITHAAYNSTAVGMSLLFTTALKDWNGFALKGLSDPMNSIFTAIVISIPFAALLFVAYWAFVRVTPPSAAWKPQPYAARSATFPHWLPWLGVGLGSILMMALTAFASSMGNIDEMMENLRRMMEQMR